MLLDTFLYSAHQHFNNPSDFKEPQSIHQKRSLFPSFARGAFSVEKFYSIFHPLINPARPRAKNILTFSPLHKQWPLAGPCVHDKHFAMCASPQGRSAANVNSLSYHHGEPSANKCLQNLLDFITLLQQQVY